MSLSAEILPHLGSVHTYSGGWDGEYARGALHIQSDRYTCLPAIESRGLSGKIYHFKLGGHSVHNLRKKGVIRYGTLKKWGPLGSIPKNGGHSVQLCQKEVIEYNR